MRQAKELIKLSVKRTNFISKRELFLLVGYLSGYHLVNYHLCVCPRMQSAKALQRGRRNHQTRLVRLCSLGMHLNETAACRNRRSRAYCWFHQERPVMLHSEGEQNSFCQDQGQKTILVAVPGPCSAGKLTLLLPILIV